MSIKSLIIIYTILGLIIFFVLLFIFCLKQEVEVLNELSCEELKECILLEISCGKFVTHNSFLGFNWDAKGRFFLFEQSEEYKLNCMDFLE